jgi:RNA polymerase sigma factor (sigma-70 family)
VDARQTTFHELYSRYAADVYRFAHWLTGNADDAQDITSETFVRAWTAPEEPRMETVKAYLFAIARNLHRKQWRRQSRLEPMDEAMPSQPQQAEELRRVMETSVPQAVASANGLDEVRSFRETRRRLRRRSWLMAFAIFFSLAPFSFAWTSGRVWWLLRDAPASAVVYAAFGLVFWVIYAVERSRSRSL